MSTVQSLIDAKLAHAHSVATEELKNYTVSEDSKKTEKFELLSLRVRATLPVSEYRQAYNETSDKDRYGLSIIRDKMLKETQYEAEKEHYYNSEVQMDVFRTSMANAILVTSHTFYNNSERTFGDSRGERVAGAKQHFQSCGIKSMNSYTEEASWDLSDSFSSDAHVGIKAELSCKCGEMFRLAAYLKDVSLGDLLSLVLSDPNPYQD